MNKKIFAIITARGKSKRVERKNIKPLCGKPLIYYTIEEAKKSKYIDKLIVSTDDKEIAEISESYGVDVPFLRPSYLSKDNIKSVDVLIHAVQKMISLYNITPDIIVLLEPTAPLREVSDIDNCIKLHLDSEVDSVVSVVECKNRHPIKSKIIKDGLLKDYCFEEKEIFRTQELPSIYFRNGAYYSVKTEVLLKEKKLYGKKIKPYIMPVEKSLDINEEYDFKIAEMLMKERLEIK